MSSVRTICYLGTHWATRQRATSSTSDASEKRVATTTDRQSALPGERLDALRRWVRSLEGLGKARLEPASGDASFRRYFRVSSGASTWIAMDAPPPMEDCRPFVEIAGYLQSMSLNGPDIVAGDVDRGFLLMSDLGRQTYLDRLRDSPAAGDSIYEDAVDALLQLQSKGAVFQAHLPPYDEVLLRNELALFHDWLCERHLGLVFSEADEREWAQVCEILVDNALAQPEVFVHRDFHSRNLMVTAENNPGILDFQDAVEGPLTYDLVSLLRDCYLRLEPGRVAALCRRFVDGLDAGTRARVDGGRFETFFDLMGVQRHLKAAGIFARLLLRDGKDGYLADVPRTLSYIVAVGPRYPALSWLRSLVEQRCLPALGAQA